MGARVVSAFLQFPADLGLAAACALAALSKPAVPEWSVCSVFSLLVSYRALDRKVSEINGSTARRREDGRGGASVVARRHDGRDEVVFFFARRCRGAPPRDARMFRSCLIESSRRASRAGRVGAGRVGAGVGSTVVRLLDKGGRQPQASDLGLPLVCEAASLLAGGLGLRQPLLEVFDRGRLLGPSVGGLVPRPVEAPLFFEGLSVVGGLVPRVFKAPLFFEAPPLDVRGFDARRRRRRAAAAARPRAAGTAR